jgi:hypothetical protein
MEGEALGCGRLMKSSLIGINLSAYTLGLLHYTGALDVGTETMKEVLWPHSDGRVRRQSGKRPASVWYGSRAVFLSRAINGAACGDI